MYKIILYCILSGLLLPQTILGQQQPKDLTVHEYLDKFKNIAIQEMERSGIPASITLAQGIHESAFGNSELARKSNNHFGIKCGSKWTGKGFYKWDDDPQKSCFRVYESAEQSYVDHSDFLMHRSRYAFLFEYGRHEYKKWAKGLRKAGYATDPKYPDKLIHSIEKYNLTQYDQESGQLAFENKTAVNTVSADWPAATYRQKSRSFLFKEYKTGLFRENGSTYAIARKEESALAVAKRFGIPYERFLKFNDLKDGDLLIAFQPTYIQPKKNSYRGEETYYVVTKDITMYEIAQCFGLKLASLLSKNLLNQGEEPQNGTKIYLKEKALQKPALRSYLHIDTLPPSPSPNLGRPKSNPTKEKETISYQPPALAINIDRPVYTQAVYADTAQLNTSVVSKDSMQAYQRVETTATNHHPATSASNTQINTAALFVPNTVEQPKTLSQAKKEQLPNTINTSTTVFTSGNKGPQTTHLVKQGETLYRLHRLYKVSVDAIKEANQIYGNAIAAGSTLKIPTP
jgi:LysM repeat protein